MVPTLSTSQRREVPVRDVQIPVVESGSGGTVLFLHGMNGVAASAEAIAALASRFHVVAPELPGFDSSPLLDEIETVDDLSYLVLDLVAGLAEREGPVAVIGCSIGAWVAASAATKSTAGISALVLAAPIGIKTGGTLELDYLDLYAVGPEAVAAAMHADPAFGRPDFAAMSDEQLARHFRNLEATAKYGWKPYMHDTKLLGRLARIDVPVLVLAGEQDGFASPKIADAFAQRIAGAALSRLADAGHEPERETPAAFSAACTEFLAGLASAVDAA